MTRQVQRLGTCDALPNEENDRALDDDLQCEPARRPKPVPGLTGDYHGTQ